jgi:hypothetical protein
MKLGPEPDAKDKLPEEASSDAVDDQEMMQDLLKGSDKPKSDPAQDDLVQAGERMGRSHQRLAMNKDAGKVTQEIQKRILANLDALIDQARKQEAESKSQPNPQKPQQAGQPSPVQVTAQAHNTKSSGQKPNAGHTPASASVAGHDMNTDGTPTTDITQSLKEWGDLSPRQRAAIIEAGSEKPVQKFKEFIDEYYQALGNQQAQ